MKRQSHIRNLSVITTFLAFWSAPPADAGVTYFQGMCDASAVAAAGPQYLFIADDEDNVVRLYDRSKGGAPVWSTDLSAFLQVDPRKPEVDLEGAARVGDRIYWISSHGRNRKARVRSSRHRFFATEIVTRGGVPKLAPVGVPYANLLDDLLADPRLEQFGLRAAARLAPKDDRALNIEGLGSLPDGRLLLGFRNPQPGGKALIVPLENPDEVIRGKRARFGDPMLVDLGERGVRGLGGEGSGLVILAGSHKEEARPAVFRWFPAENKVSELQNIEIGDLNPESLELVQDGSTEALLVVSDDGSVRIGKKPCKNLKDPRQKRFRMAVIELTP